MKALYLVGWGFAALLLLGIWLGAFVFFSALAIAIAGTPYALCALVVHLVVRGWTPIDFRSGPALATLACILASALLTLVEGKKP